MAMNVGDGKEDDVMMEVNTTPLGTIPLLPSIPGFSVLRLKDR